MKRFFSILAFVLLAASSAWAHVGSPNVFYEGKAGSYPIYAVIRPPAALPGMAQASVRVDADDIRTVSLLPVIWPAGREGSPSPIPAQRVAGETNLWSAEVWLLRPGSYTVQIAVEGAHGSSEVAVPVNVLGLQSQPMRPGLKATLLALGVGLFLGAVLIAKATARDGGLSAEAKPIICNIRQGRKAAGIAWILLIIAVTATAARWQRMDRAYRSQGLQKPEPVSATLRSETNRVVMELRPAEQTGAQPSWTTLLPDHGKLMHLFLIRDPELDVFAHLHPQRIDAHTFTLNPPPLPAGKYQLYGDITYENGLNQTLVTQVELPAPVGPPLELPQLTNLMAEVLCGFTTGVMTNLNGWERDWDDSWHAGNDKTTSPAKGGLIARLMGGYTLWFENADAVMAGRDTSMRFAVFTPDGSEAELQPYMGMFGHAVVRRVDGSVFAHLHPSGSFSMASQELFRQNDQPASLPAGNPSPQKTNVVSFPYEFPNAGEYRIWVQVRVTGRVLTGVCRLNVKASR